MSRLLQIGRSRDQDDGTTASEFGWYQHHDSKGVAKRGSRAGNPHVSNAMTFKGSLPSGQDAFNDQQYVQPGAYLPPVYGNGQDPPFSEPGFINPSDLQQAPPMHYGAGAGVSNGPTFTDELGGLFLLQQYQPPTPSIPYLAPSVQQPTPTTAPVVSTHAPAQTRAPAPSYPQTIQPSQLDLGLEQHRYPAQAQSPAQHAMGNVNGTPAAPRSPALPSPTWVKPEPKPSSKTAPSTSPALSQKSPGISKKSLSKTPRPSPLDTYPVMVAIGEECIQKAHEAARSVAITLDPDRVAEYQKLVSMGLHCLETAVHSRKLTPRQEAMTLLRYASLLCEETENLMDAETTLSKGITLCDKHRYFDLKYSMQYLLLKVLFQRNQKAALKATDKYIADATAFKHTHWSYAFRFLKASFFVQSGSPSDSAALENFKAISALATERGDNAVIVFTSLLEGLTLLKTVRDDTVMRVQACIAHASKFQLDADSRMNQLEVLKLILDLSCSMIEKTPESLGLKLRTIYQLLDTAPDDTWGDAVTEIQLPILKPQSSLPTISEDTAAILRPGKPDQARDYLIMSFLSKSELHALM